MKEALERYLKNQNNFREKWQVYFSLPPNFDESHLVLELTPLYGSKCFEEIDREHRWKFNLEYIKFLAEGQVFFEQIIEYGIWQIIKNNKVFVDVEAKKALRHFAMEEVYHSNGFRHFLHIHPSFEWDKNKIYAHSKLLRRLITMLIRFSPASVFLPAAKLEAFTLSYCRSIHKYYPDQKSNSWIYLNHIHQLDEAFHIPLDFLVHDNLIEKRGFVKTLMGSIVLVLIMQVALFIGAYKVVHYTFSDQKMGLLKKIIYTFKLAYWAVKVTPAYNDARIITKKQFEIKKPKHGKWWSFVYW